MTNITHPELVAALAKPGDAILKSLTAEKCHTLHMAIGISGEAGELLDAIKKHVFYEKEIDRDNVVEELGDLAFYIEGLATSLGITREEYLNQNIAKLTIRYGQKYSNQAAQHRADKN